MKDTFYFQHDYNARNDPKLQRLLMTHGCEGIGIYWCIVEQLYEQGGKLPNNHIETIAFNLHTTKTTVEEVVFGLNLFVSDDEFFWSESVLKRIENRSLISSIRSDAGKKGGAPIGNKNAVKRNKTNNIHIESNSENNQMVESETSKNNQMVEKNKQKQAIKEKEIKVNNIKEYIFKEKKEEKKESGAETSSAPPPQKIKKNFTPPSVEEVRAYCEERNNGIIPENFIDFYTSKGWMIGKNKMIDWRAAVRTWEKRNKQNGNTRNTIHNVPTAGTHYETTFEP